MNTLGGIVRFFQEGGAFMYPILIVFALGAAIAVERWMYPHWQAPRIARCGRRSCRF